MRPADWVASLFPTGVTAAEVRGTASPTELLPAEGLIIATAGKKRQTEFAAGRVCARRALVDLGIGVAPILARQDRTPIWPNRCVGSISHTDLYAVAVAGLTRQFAGLGVDAEMIDRVDSSLWEILFRTEEIRRLRSLPKSQQLETAAAMFSAKEAFYKCQFPITQSWLGFENISVDISGNAFCISVCPGKIAMKFTHQPLYGAYAIDDTRVVCGIAIRA